MSNIEEKTVAAAETTAIPASDSRKLVSIVKRARCALIFGAMSVVLYTLLYVFNIDLAEIAHSTHNGDKTLFFVPIVVALVFSFIHGSFTSHFWEFLGVQAKKS